MEVEVFQKKLAEIVTCARYNNRKLDGEFVEKFFCGRRNGSCTDGEDL